MSKAKLSFFVVLLLAAGLVAVLIVDRDATSGSGRPPLVMFCAAGIRAPVTEIAEAYQQEYGVEIQLQFAGSGTLLSSLAVGGGDIYLAGDASYTAIAREKGLLEEIFPVSFLTAGFGVPAGNPQKLASLDDLARPGLRIGLANPEAASVGKFTKKILSKHGHWDGLEPEVLFPTVNELANALKLGTIDVAILWDATANQYPEVDFVHLPEFDVQKKTVSAGVLSASSNPTGALKFLRYLTARDRGAPVFAEHGFEILENADLWEETPEVLLYSGAMLRPAIEETIAAFEEREGVRITPVFNGCGILVSQMKAGEKPDAYFSCDVKFMDMVKDRFEDATTVSANDMVLIVEKGNPKGIETLNDLLKPNLRLGFAHPVKSALGFLTKLLLEGEGLYEKILASGNLKLDSPTGDFLVNQIKTGSLDCVIVYRSNALASKTTKDHYEIIDIDRPNAVAEQPWAIGRNSEHKQLLERFYEAVVSQAGKDRFLTHGFRWELED
ncbi:MAG: extracellular solute-binding protein [Verrucomicrobiales bacterium]